ncbi:MAG TPA: hypothetical protein VI076_01680 [Actinopolymorphaceae bacterium]
MTIGEPHKFDQLGWFDPESLPTPLHSQLTETLELFRAWFAVGGAATRR